MRERGSQVNVASGSDAGDDNCAQCCCWPSEMRSEYGPSDSATWKSSVTLPGAVSEVRQPGQRRTEEERECVGALPQGAAEKWCVGCRQKWTQEVYFKMDDMTACLYGDGNDAGEQKKKDNIEKGTISSTQGRETGMAHWSPPSSPRPCPLPSEVFPDPPPPQETLAFFLCGIIDQVVILGLNL